MKRSISIYIFVLLTAAAALAQGTGFNFQGRLNDGTNPANGRYDLQFRLYDAVVSGGQVGPLVPRPNTDLVNGVFSTTLDFGATAFNNPNNIFIEIAVRPAGSPNAYTILGPRQQLAAVPFAVRSASAANADNAVNAVNAATASNALSLGGTPPAGYARMNQENPGSLKINGNLTLGLLGFGGNVDMNGNLNATGTLTVNGNASQSPTAFGLVKAMVHVGRNGLILSCRNGLNGLTTGNCGLDVSMPLLGVYRIDFHGPIYEHFVSITPEYGTSCVVTPISCRNAGANFRFFGTSSIEVFTFNADNEEDTSPASFMLIIF